MKIRTCIVALTVAATLAFSVSTAHAQIEFDQDVTNEVIVGSGIGNGGFTTDRADGVELGLRGKLRFDENNLPQNTFNSDGAGNYTFQAGNPPTGFSFDPNNPTTPVWSFEWSINSDYDGSSAWNLDDLTYEMSIDADPGAGVNLLTFDPINDTNPATTTVQWDHGIGDNSTGNGDGAFIPNTATDAAGYADLIANNNLAQNSWNYEFFNDGPPLDSFDPNDLGTYEIALSAFDGAAVVARTGITVNVVPEPTTLALFGLASVCGLAVIRRRRVW